MVGGGVEIENSVCIFSSVTSYVIIFYHFLIYILNLHDGISGRLVEVL